MSIKMWWLDLQAVAITLAMSLSFWNNFSNRIMNIAIYDSYFFSQSIKYMFALQQCKSNFLTYIHIWMETYFAQHTGDEVMTKMKLKCKKKTNTYKCLQTKRVQHNIKMCLSFLRWIYFCYWILFSILCFWI